MSETKTHYAASKWTPRPIIGQWTPDQARVASCFPDLRRLVVVAANGVGKTYLAADLVASFIKDLPAAAVILTAPTNRQVSELLWPHVTERLLLLDLADEDWVIPTKPKWKGGDADTLIGFATNTVHRLSGFHAQHLLIIMDEASGMPQKLVDALEGIAVAEQNYILAIGNPNELPNALYNLTQRASWRTEQITALTHPNILERRETIPGATTWLALCDRIRDWCTEQPAETSETFSVEISDAETGSTPSGAKSQESAPIGVDPHVRRLRHFLPNDEFRIRYLGRFPLSASWSLINRGYIDAAQDRPNLAAERPKLSALDVARTGGDRTVYGLRQGDTVTRLTVIPPADLMTQAETVAAILRDDDPESITVDAAGLGIGLIDRLRQITNVPVMAFSGSGEPISPSAKKKYFNRRAAAYANLAEAFEEGHISIPKDPELADELASVKYKHVDGKLQVLDKEIQKAKIGKSPDSADTVSLLWETGTYYHSPAIITERPREESW